MIRPFQLRDWGRLSRLSANSVPLNASLILTFPSSPQRGAVLHRVLRRNYPTYIWRAEPSGPQAFVQLRLSKDWTQANVLWVGTSVAGRWRLPGREKSAEPWTQEDVWQTLFDDLGVYLGARGVHNLIAEAREDSVEAGLLREIGFANYSRQDLWKLEETQPVNNNVARLLTPRRQEDDWAIELLYAHTVPNMIRLIEPHPTIGSNSWVHYEGTDLTAYASYRDGRSADWLDLLVKLSADADIDQLVRDAIIFRPPSRERPLYCNVRHYQDWLQQPLENNGFQHIGSQVVMVRHTVQKVKRKVVNSLESVLQTNSGTVNTSPWVQKATEIQKIETSHDS